MQGLGLERDLDFGLAKDADPDAEGARFRPDGSAYLWKASFERLFLQTPVMVAESRPSLRGVPFRSALARSAMPSYTCTSYATTAAHRYQFPPGCRDSVKAAPAKRTSTLPATCAASTMADTAPAPLRRPCTRSPNFVNMPPGADRPSAKARPTDG
ncbi:hypothetical protein [Actinomadura nitritigenes]|uniref:hypothetical protein n=1 Tax=Actinomadura nitritigenes TaxID=134602 RepID=UPI003D89E3A9